MAAAITRRLVSLADAPGALAIAPRTIRRYSADGQVEAVRLGRKTLPIWIDSIERCHRRPAGRRLALIRDSAAHVRAGSLRSDDLRREGVDGAG